MGICKYINYYTVGTMDYFQGMNITGRHIEETGEIKIFESLKSVMKLCGYGIWDSVSAEKHSLTDEQLSIIIKSNIKNVVLCYDSDVSYDEKAVCENIRLLKRFVNVYIIEDTKGLLGGKEARNAPIDKGIDIWNTLYSERRKIL
jgi:DNA primase